MLQLNWFFRRIPDASIQEASVAMYVVAIFFFSLGVLWYVRYAPKWRLRWQRRLILPLYVLTFLSFFCQLLWRGYAMGLSQALPLTWIGLAQLLMLATWVRHFRMLQEGAAVIGFSAALLLFIAPAPLDFLWPHISLVLYFVSAFSAGWLATILALSAESEWTKRSVMLVALFMTVYEGVRLGINRFSPIDVPLLHRASLVPFVAVPVDTPFFTVIHLLLSLGWVIVTGFFLIFIRRYSDSALSVCIDEWQTTTLSSHK